LRFQVCTLFWIKLLKYCLKRTDEVVLGCQEQRAKRELLICALVFSLREKIHKFTDIERTVRFNFGLKKDGYLIFKRSCTNERVGTERFPICLRQPSDVVRL